MVITPGALAVAVTLALFLAGVIYQSGRLAARVESLEAWRTEMTSELSAIHNGIRRLEGMIRGEGV